MRSNGHHRANAEALVGSKAGAWDIIGPVVHSGSGKNGRFSVWCQCSCEAKTTKIVALTSLLSGKSYGCLACSPGRKSDSHKNPDRIEQAARKKMSFYRSRSTHRTNREFTLEFSEFFELVTSDCFYCGAKPKEVVDLPGGDIRGLNGVDRVDNDLGYISSNVVACCEQCNRAKLAMSLDEFSSLVDRLAGRKSVTGWKRIELVAA